MNQKAIRIVGRIVAYLLCVVSVIGFCLSVLGMIFLGQTQNYKEVLERGYKNIAGNYSAEAMHYFLDNDMTALANNFMDTGFRFSIVKMENKEEAAQTLYSNAEENAEFTFSHRFYSTYPDYNTGNLLGGINYYEAQKESYTENTVIYAYVLDTNKGIFYAETPRGYFEIKYIDVKYDNAIYDYKLQNIDGKRCYYNNYYELMLDMTKTSEWEWVRSDDQYMYDYEITTDSAGIEAELYSGEFYISEDDVYYSVTDDTQYMVYSYVELETTDHNTGLFMEWKRLVDSFYAVENKLEAIQIGSLLLFIITLIFLIYSTQGTRETLTLIQKIPVFTYAVTISCIEIGLGALFIGVAEELGPYFSLTFRTYAVILTEIAFVIVLIALFFITNITARLKAKSFWRYSEFYYLLVPFAWMRKKWKEFYCTLQRNGSLIGKASIFITIVFFVEFFVLLEFDYCRNVLPWFFFYKLIEVPLTILLLIQMNTLQSGAKRVASGNLAQPIDTGKMFWEFKKHGQYINQSGEGISLAVEERMKSERLKTELITNVSHDIKTPLTSIINYVDLIKKQDITDETLLEYIDVLDRQSARLKKLIEDLMEASKASTGNLTCNMEDCNLDVFLGQLMGEFEEKLNQIGLELILTKPEEVLYILADGRHLWRIMDNLMNNIYKYSLPYSRVYINVEKTGQIVTIILKNISKSQLNISSDELMERFVRGDSSRNTEGNGLGLSIAQSLTELMGGILKLDIDGDLFKVTLQFTAVEKKQEDNWNRSAFTVDSDKEDDEYNYQPQNEYRSEDKIMDAEIKELSLIDNFKKLL